MTQMIEICLRLRQSQMNIFFFARLKRVSRKEGLIPPDKV